jgi:hypothetical protein
MRRLSLVVVCCGVFQLLAAAPAQAWFGWVDQWSGPGSFLFVDGQWRLACIQDPRIQEKPKGQKGDVTPMASDGTVGLRSLDSFEHKWAAAAIGAGCLLQSNKNPSGSLNFKVGYWWSLHNNLQYAANVSAPTIHVWQFEPSFAVFTDATRFFELSSGIGMLSISGDGFSAFQRFYLKPVQVTITPGATLKNTEGAARAARPFAMSFGIMMMPDGMDAADFGAIPGSFHTDKEIQATFAVTWDLSRF